MLEVEIPSKVLNCRIVSRELTFTSKHEINDFNIVQRIMVQQETSQASIGPNWVCLEEWAFQFGFVIAGSTNSWQSVVVSATNNRSTKSADGIYGVMFLIETSFYDGKRFISKNSVKVRYV